MWSERLALSKARAGAVKAALGVLLYVRIVHRTRAASAAASNISAIPGPVVAQAKLGRGMLRKKIDRLRR